MIVAIARWQGRNFSKVGISSCHSVRVRLLSEFNTLLLKKTGCCVCTPR